MVEQKESIFNFGLAYLQRLDQILGFCQMSALKQDIDNWLQGLRAIEREVCIKYEGNETVKNKISNVFSEINSLCSTHGAKTRNKQKILLKLHELDKEFRSIIKPILDPTKADPTKAIYQT